MEDENSDPFADEPAPAPKPRNKGLFNRKAAPPPPKRTESNEAVDFFSQSNAVYKQQMLEKQRKREKKLAKEERKRSSASVERKTSSPAVKRQRTSSRSAYSSDEDTGGTGKLSSPRTPGSLKSDKSPSQDAHRQSPQTLGGRYSRDLATTKQPIPIPTSRIITLTDSEDDEVQSPPVRNAQAPVLTIDNDGDSFTFSAPPPRSPAEVDEDIEPPEEEEFPELVQQARYAREKAALERHNALKKFEKQNHVSDNNDDDDVFQLDGPKIVDPVVEILVISEIQDTKPLILKRKLNSDLKPVRMSWCDRQVVQGSPMFPSPEAKASIFLVFNKKKIYDFTTCAALGLELDDQGRITSSDGINSDGRIVLTAWTEHLFNEWNRKQEEWKREQQKEQDVTVTEAEVPKLRLKLKSKEYPEYKMKMKPSTTFEKIISAFRLANKIPDQQEIVLRFDGDVLDPDATVEDMDIEDMSSIDVYLK